MNSKSTATLCLLALLVFGYILVFERHRTSTDAQATQDRLLFPAFKADRVTGIDLVRTNLSLHVIRTNDEWFLTHPPYPAQTVRIQNWLGLLGQLRRYSHLPNLEVQEQAGGLAAFGLEPPVASLTLEQGAERQHLRIGGRAPLGKRIYIQRVGGEGIDVTDDALLDQLPSTPGSWRDPAFVQLAGLRFDRFRVLADGHEIEVQRDSTNRLWRLVKPRNARADVGRLEALLQQLQAVAVTDFVNDFPSADLEPYGLQPPRVSLSFNQETNEILRVDFGRAATNAPGELFARRSTSPSIVRVPADIADLLAAPYTDYLDNQLLDLDIDRIERVEIVAPDRFVLQRQTNGTWRGTEPVAFPADPGLVQELFARFQALRIQEIAKEIATELELPSYGLLPPARSYSFTPGPNSASNPPSPARVDFGAQRGDRIYARRADENSVYAMKLDTVLGLPSAAFELRDRRIWDFPTNQVQSLTVNFRDDARTLLRSPNGAWSFAAGSQGIVNTFALEEAVHRLGQLRARFWVAAGPDTAERYGFAQARHRVTLTLRGTPDPVVHTVEFGGRSPSGGPYASVTLEFGRVVFECPLDIAQAYGDVLRGLGIRLDPTP